MVSVYAERTSFNEMRLDDSALQSSSYHNDPADVYDRKEELSSVFRCVHAKMTEIEKRVLSLYFDGLSKRAISRYTGFSRRATGSQLKRACKKIARELAS